MILFDITELVVGFEKTALSVSESGGQIEICVKITQICVNITQPSSVPIEIKFNLTVRTSAGTAS